MYVDHKSICSLPLHFDLVPRGCHGPYTRWTVLDSIEWPIRVYPVPMGLAIGLGRVGVAAQTKLTPTSQVDVRQLITWYFNCGVDFHRTNTPIMECCEVATYDGCVPSSAARLLKIEHAAEGRSGIACQLKLCNQPAVPTSVGVWMKQWRVSHQCSNRAE